MTKQSSQTPPHTQTSCIQHLRQMFNHKLYWVIRNRWLSLNRNTKTTEITTTTQEARPRRQLWVHLREEHFQFAIKWHEWVCWTRDRDVERIFGVLYEFTWSHFTSINCKFIIHSSDLNIFSRVAWAWDDRHRRKETKPHTHSAIKDKYLVFFLLLNK